MGIFGGKRWARPDELAWQEAQRPALPDSSSQPRGNEQTSLADLVGAPPAGPRGFWNGGNDFKVRDGLAGILAVVSDAFARQNGGTGNAVSSLGASRSQGIEGVMQALKDYQQNKKIAALPGMSARELAAWQADPKAWGGHMADAYSTHYAAANLNPGDQRVFGNPQTGAPVYQSPTAAEQYAASLGHQRGTAEYDTAVRDYTLRANGPTAFGYDTRLDDHRTANDLRVEGVRQGNRVSLEGVRQGNRMATRGAPTYRDLNPPAPRASGPRSAPRKVALPTATDANGNKIEWNGSDWVPVR